MHTILATIDAVFSALSRFCTALSDQFSALAGHRLGLFGLAAIIVTSLLLAIACSAWALIERWRRFDYRSRLQVVLRRAQFARHFRDSILDSLPEMVVVLRSKFHNPLSFGGGSALLQHCLDGPDAKPLAVAIDDLLHHGSGFSLSVRLSSLRQIFVRGLRIGSGEALFLRTQDRVSGQVLIRHKSLQITPLSITLSPETFPGPAPSECDGEIVISPDGRLKHYNQAFARLWSLHDDELRTHPLWTELAARYIARDGHDAIWDIVSYAATVADPERLNDWVSLPRSSSERISLAVSRMKDGATRIIFTVRALPAETPPTDETALAA